MAVVGAQLVAVRPIAGRGKKGVMGESKGATMAHNRVAHGGDGQIGGGGLVVVV
jgi:hypothetical protein